MDIKSSRKVTGKIPKPSVVSPIKDNGKLSLGFRGFKIVNSNIRIVKQVDVRTPILKPKTQTESASPTVSLLPSIPSKNLTTAESLKKLRERVLLKKKQHEELAANDAEKEALENTSNLVPNGIHLDSSETLLDNKPVTTPDPKAVVIEKVPGTSELSKSLDLPDSHHADNKSATSILSKSDKPEEESSSSTKDKKEQSKKKHSSEGAEKRPRLQTPTTSHSHSHRRDPSHRKNRERMKSPHRDREPRHSKLTSYNSSKDRSRSPHRDKESYSTKKGSSSRRSQHNSSRRKPMHVRKYSAPQGSSRSSNNSSRSRFHSRGHHDEKRNLHVDVKDHRSRSSSHRRSSTERSSSSRGKLSSDGRDSTATHKDKTKSSHSRQSTEHRKHFEKKTERSSESKKPANPGGLYSKLSFSLLNEEEEQFEEIENSSIEEKHYESEALDTDLESFHTINDTEDSEVDTACEDELPLAKIDEPETDVADCNSVKDEEDDASSDGHGFSVKGDSSEDDATDAFHDKNESLQEIVSKEEIDDEPLKPCSIPLDGAKKLLEATEYGDELAKPVVVSLEAKYDISCEGIDAPNALVENEIKEEQTVSETESSPRNVPPENCTIVSQSDMENNTHEERNEIAEPGMSEKKATYVSNTMSPPSTICETNKILETQVLLLKQETDLDSTECHGSWSEKAPIRLTPYAKDISSVYHPTSNVPSASPDPPLKTVTEKVLSPENKIHAMASQLKDVFNSLLQTDFKTDDESKTAEAQKLNGVISPITTDISDADEVEYKKTFEVLVEGSKVKNEDTVEVCANEHRLITDDCSSIAEGTEFDVKVTLHDEAAKMSSETDSQNDTNDSAVLPMTPARPHSSYPSMVVASDKTAKLSPHKLKLHATTRTPLPAKKSYVRQVQSDKNDTVSRSYASVDSRLMDSMNAELGLVSDAELQESKPSPVATSLGEDHVAPILDSHCEANLVEEGAENVSSVQDSVLSQNDSSGSSALDNEEGPRRSARIRTKKTERSLKTQVSVENNAQNLPAVNDTSEIFKLADTTVEATTDDVQRLPENLSGEELFKARINVTKDTSDCPELFELLEENLYLTSMKKSRARKEIRRMVCDCALEETIDSCGPCGENCLNRLLMIECSSRCHYGNKCTNKRFQHRRYAPSEVFKTSFKGWGIRAAADIEQGELVMEYCGEVVDQREFTRRSLEYSKSNHAHFYFMALSQDEVIDATYKGNSSRFINHSCDPNAETQKWTVNGRLRVGFFTLRRIDKGEEITFDYQFERYGKVAQKCFCGTAKCRGYLGKAPDEGGGDDTKVSKLLSNEALSPLADTSDDSPEKDQQKKKKLDYFTDNTMEKDISKLLGGLRSTKEVLSLSRLMVRCDTHTQRIMCLQVLRETSSQTRLKTFLQFHGLSIIWSWMVDISSVDDEDSLTLKLEIIDTLCILPITNKNVIDDSKVLSVVQRWAKPEVKQNTASQEDGSLKEVETTPTKGNQDADIPSTTNAIKEAISSEVPDDPKVTISSTEDAGEKSEETEKEPIVTNALNESSNDNVLIKSNENVLEAAASLLESWKDLREIYRIPKRQKPLPSPNQESSSRDNSVSRNSSPSSKVSRFDDIEQRPSRVGNSRRGSSQERWRDSSDRFWDYKHRDKRTDFTDNQISPGSSNSSEHRKEVGRRKRRLSTDSDEISKELPWHCRTPRNNMKMSRQEYRRRFEKDVEKREQEKKRMEEQMEVEMSQNAMFSMQPQQFIGGIHEEIPSLMGQDLSMVGQPIPGNATFTPSGFSGNLIQINPTPPAPIMVDPYLNISAGQQLNVMHQCIQQPQNPYSVQVPLQPNYSVSGMYGQDPNLQPGMYSINDPNLMTQQRLNPASQQIFPNTSIGLVQPQIQQQQQPPPQPTNIQPQAQQPNNNVTILGSQNGQAIVLLSAEQLQKLTQGDLSVLKESLQGQNSDGKKNTDAKQQGNSKSSPNKSKESKDPKLPIQLPPNWKTATDDEGRVYYYHAITRQTQWDPPTWDGKEEDLMGKKDAENMDLSSTPTHDERLAKSSRKKNDGVTEEGRKAKETFRLKMSQFVVQCLSSYRKPDKKIGRITSTEDFKHLARKLTHNVMEKELKQVRVFEDLDFNANVKHKTKEYVKKYMSKVGPVYKIKDDT